MRRGSSLVLGWKLSALDVGLASIRYRALFPLLALQRRDVSSKVFASGSVRNLTGVDVLVIVKSFTADDLALVQAAVEKNIPVIFDLCDNIFVDGYCKFGVLSPVDVVRQIAILSTVFVTPTEVLADVLRDQLDDNLAVYVVPDCIETGPLFEAAVKVITRARENARRRSLIERIRDSEKVRKLVNLLRTGSVRGIIYRLAKYACRKLESARARILGRPSPVVPRPVSSKKVQVTDRIRDSQKVRKLVDLLRTGLVRGIIYRLAKYAYRKLEPARARILGRPSPVVPRPVSSKKVQVTPLTPPNGEIVNQVVSSSVRQFDLSPASLYSRRLLWFGNHGARHGGRFGMIDLVENKAALERIAREFDVELVVVSNHVEKFHQLITPLEIPSRYVEWSPARVQEELGRADIVLVPNSCDEFSLCKSANRTALALMANRPVVATLTPALIPLVDCIETGDFYTGIRHYLNDPKRVSAHLEIARERCEQLYGQEAIADAWRSVLDAVLFQSQGQQPLQSELIIVANLVSDVEFIRAIAAAAQKCRVATAIWVSTSMIRRWPYTLAILTQSGASLRVIAETEDGAVLPRFPRSVRAVLTVADTNLAPHRFSRSITQAANKAGVVTGTLQHGFENVGLTYSDDVQVIERIDFAAQHIFVWGDLSQLHPRVKESTRGKCIPVGCPKMVAAEHVAPPSIVPRGKPVVGIFENLHWHRYDDSYRSFFLDGALRLAATHPDITFIIKSHNAGRWLTTRFNGELTDIDNLLIADPSKPQWWGLTVSSMLQYMSGIITSPSTVALDAARTGLPVAVVAHGLALDNYAPLYQIQAAAQWADFVARLFDDTCRKRLTDASDTFVARVVLPGDAATRIVNQLLSPDSISVPNHSESLFSLSYKKIPPAQHE